MSHYLNCVDEECNRIACVDRRGAEQELGRLRAKIKKLTKELEAFKPRVCEHDDPSWCNYECFRGQLAFFRQRARRAEDNCTRYLKLIAKTSEEKESYELDFSNDIVWISNSFERFNVLFGRGEIYLGTARNGDGNPCMIFCRGPKAELNEKPSKEQIKKTGSTFLAFHFDNVKSVDACIRVLEEIKKTLGPKK